MSDSIEKQITETETASEVEARLMSIPRRPYRLSQVELHNISKIAWGTAQAYSKSVGDRLSDGDNWGKAFEVIESIYNAQAPGAMGGRSGDLKARELKAGRCLFGEEGPRSIAYAKLFIATATTLLEMVLKEGYGS